MPGESGHRSTLMMCITVKPLGEETATLEMPDDGGLTMLCIDDTILDHNPRTQAAASRLFHLGMNEMRRRELPPPATS